MAKIDRKKLLKEPDEFLTLSDRAVRLSKLHLRKLMVLASVLAAAVAAILGIQTYLGYRGDQASQAMGQVFMAYAATLSEQATPEQIDQAIKGLSQVVDQYGATDAGMQARLALGDLMLRKGDPERAEQVFSALAEEPDLPAELAPLAQAGAGHSQEARKKYAEAAEAYGAAAKASGPYQAPLYRLDQARVLLAAGQKQQAEGLYRDLLKQTQDQAIAQAARQNLVAMGLETDPPTAAPPEAAPPAGK